MIWTTKKMMKITKIGQCLSCMYVSAQGFIYFGPSSSLFVVRPIFSLLTKDSVTWLLNSNAARKNKHCTQDVKGIEKGKEFCDRISKELARDVFLNAIQSPLLDISMERPTAYMNF
ncbi:hypothetical protein M8C21_015481 [Ambrosia artemisiifolia]|uniref:Uncharacterized protein n=1 Tax=Ambrosia artemisiifolia TaxID=4212 RepID=A0AAD5BTJ0_AMBAR|nr:hypothetical protein M8C21_015481 [Ambrosia artemisiifolia]